MTPSSAPAPQARPPRKSGVVVPNAPRWHQRLLALVIWLVARGIALTLRYRLHDPGGFTRQAKFGPAIYCIWHNRLPLCLEMYRRYVATHYPSPGLVGLVSASKDGALLAAIFERFGLQPVRGSSSRRGAQALVELKTWAQQGYDLAITPDGPRGPRYQVADGAVALAQITQFPLVTVSYRTSWKITLNSWDRFQIPLPFARCDVHFGEIIRVPRKLADGEREEWRQRLETALTGITHD